MVDDKPKERHQHVGDQIGAWMVQSQDSLDVLAQAVSGHDPPWTGEQLLRTVEVDECFMAGVEVDVHGRQTESK
jgi:hypothetical protein